MPTFFPFWAFYESEDGVVMQLYTVDCIFFSDSEFGDCPSLVLQKSTNCKSIRSLSVVITCEIFAKPSSVTWHVVASFLHRISFTVR